MASRERAIVNNLNERARFYGKSDMLTIEDVRRVMAFYDYKSCKSGESPATSIDHVIPLALGGENKVTNLQLLTVEENKAKGDSDTDYRNGRICPDDFNAPNAQEKTYKKHDWDEMEYQYVYESKSIIDLARLHQVSQSNVEAVCSRRKWVEKRRKVRGDLGEQVAQDAAELLRSESMDALRETVTVLRGAITRWEEEGNKANFKDIIEGLKLLGAMQGQTTSRQAINVTDEPDEADVLARITQAFDAGEEEPSYTRLGDSGEDSGAGWSD